MPSYLRGGQKREREGGREEEEEVLVEVRWQ
jgi:hypothetical protein